MERFGSFGLCRGSSCLGVVVGTSYGMDGAVLANLIL